MDNPKNTIWVALGYLIINLYMGIVAAAFRNTNAWYTFLVIPIPAILAACLVAIKRPFDVLFENIRFTLNFSILSISILMLNLINVTSQTIIILFYLSMAGVSIVISTAHMIYSRIGMAYKLRPKVEYGDRKESEIELRDGSKLELNSELNLVRSNKKMQKQEDRMINSSSECLSDASRKPMASD
jgi:hypothetical protein